MVDTVDSTVILNTLGQSERYVIHLTNESDGTGESGVIKVNISDFLLASGSAPTTTTVNSIHYSIGGFNYVVVEWEHTTNDEIAVLSGNGLLEFTGFGGKDDPSSTGGAGDIVLTTDGSVDGGHYDILLDITMA